MESSPEKPWPHVLAFAALLGACSIGGGEGQLEGSFDVEDCGSDDDYRMNPSFFGAAAVGDEGPLEIRIQRGSGLISISDGLYIMVRDSYDLQQNLLGLDLPLGREDAPVLATVYFNRSCPLDRDTTPAALPATGGTVRFDAIYSPEGSDRDVAIEGELNDATFADPRNPARAARLSGYFRFLYQRGRPAQLFP